MREQKDQEVLAVVPLYIHTILASQEVNGRCRIDVKIMQASNKENCVTVHKVALVCIQ